MRTQERARQIAQVIEEVRQQSTLRGRSHTDHGSFSVTSRGGCLACDPGACPECGLLFTGDVITIVHSTKGKRTLSEKALHYLSHGITHYETDYVVQGTPIYVDLDVEEIASYLDL